jgi:hypothetical protein
MVFKYTASFGPARPLVGSAPSVAVVRARRQCASGRRDQLTVGRVTLAELQRAGFVSRPPLLRLGGSPLAAPSSPAENPADNVNDEKHKYGAQSDRSHNEPRLRRACWKTVHRNTALSIKPRHLIRTSCERDRVRLIPWQWFQF